MPDETRPREPIATRAAFLLGGLAVILLLISLDQPWLNIPLLHGWSAFSLPVDLGWELQSRAISYGLIGLVLAVVISVLLLADGPWPGVRWSSRSRRRPMTARAFVCLGVLTLAFPLLFAYQFVVANFSLVATVQDQENQAVLIKRHVSHTLPRQHLAVRSFHIDTADPGDRWRLLLMTGGPGLLISLGAAAALLYGGFLARGSFSGQRRPIPRIVLVAGAAAAVIILGRAPLALVYNYAAQAALQGGDDRGAVSLGDIAGRINPELEQLPVIHLTEGEALYRAGQSGRDVDLFLAAHERAIGLYLLAWNLDASLLKSSPADPVVRRDMAVTLEMLSESTSPVKLTPADQDTARKNSLTPLQIQVVDRAIPWLNRLVALQADNTYAHYLRGRILFTAHDYQDASADFAAALSLTTDGNMQSEGYTYLAFCRAGLRDYAGQRALLEIAARLDTGYYNSIAHSALSGLH